MGSPTHNLIKQNASSPPSHTLGLDKVEIRNCEGKRKPNDPLDNCALSADNSVEPHYTEKSSHVNSAPKDKKASHGQNAKKKSQESLSLVGGNSKPTPTWKVVGTKPFSPSFEATAKQSFLRTTEILDTTFKEFKAGGSFSSMGDSRKAIFVEGNMDLDSGVKERAQSFNLEVVSATISNYPLR